MAHPQQSHHRRCSLAIESPSDYPSNNPLNAFLVYSTATNPLQPQDNSPPPPIQQQEFSYFSYHKNTTTNNNNNNNNSHNNYNDADDEDSDDLSSLQSIHKSSSLPNLSPSSSVILTSSASSTASAISAPVLPSSQLSPFKRRVSLCDLNNFNDELRIINDSRKNSINSIGSNSNNNNATTKPFNMVRNQYHPNRHHHRHSAPGVGDTIFQDVDYSKGINSTSTSPSSSFSSGGGRCRNHHRRNSIAIKFENPKVID